MSDLADAVDLVRSLASVDASLLSDADVHELVVELARLGDVAAVLSAQWVSEWEQRDAWRADGSRSASLALSRDTKCSLASARRVLARAHAIDHLPATVAAVLDGALSIDHVDVLRAERARHGYDDEWTQAFAAAEQRLVQGCAQAVMFDDARRAAVGWGLQTLDDLELPAPDRPQSRLTRCRDRVEGTLRLEGWWSTVDAEIIETELLRCEQELLAEDRRAGNTRSHAERAAAALVRMASRSCGASGNARPLFQVVVGDESMARLIELGSGALLHPFDLLPYLDTALFESFLFDGRSTVVEVSSQRTFRGALRRAVQVRDRRCRHLSGCDVRARDADVDHLLPASRNGPTSQFNGCVGCRAHNRLGLGGTMPPPRPERPITWLDRRRARLRWAALRRTEEEDRQLTVDAYLAEVNRLLIQPLGGDL